MMPCLKHEEVQMYLKSNAHPDFLVYGERLFHAIVLPMRTFYDMTTAV
jgi:hypothetical protein